MHEVHRGIGFVGGWVHVTCLSALNKEANIPGYIKIHPCPGNKVSEPVFIVWISEKTCKYSRDL